MEEACIQDDVYLLAKNFSSVKQCKQALFTRACFYGNLKTAKWIYTCVRGICVSSDNDYVFRVACANGHLELAQWLVSICPTIHVSAKHNWAFRMACAQNKESVAKWLWTNYPKIIPDAMNNFALNHACINGHIQIVKWLLSECGLHKVFRCADMFRDVFVQVCGNGHLDMAVMLVERYGAVYKEAFCDIPITDTPFYIACQNEHMDIVRWMTTYDTRIIPECVNIGTLIMLCKDEMCHISVFDWFITTDPSLLSKDNLDALWKEVSTWTEKTSFYLLLLTLRNT